MRTRNLESWGEWWYVGVGAPAETTGDTRAKEGAETRAAWWGAMLTDLIVLENRNQKTGKRRKSRDVRTQEVEDRKRSSGAVVTVGLKPAVTRPRRFDGVSRELPDTQAGDFMRSGRTGRYQRFCFVVHVQGSGRDPQCSTSYGHMC